MKNKSILKEHKTLKIKSSFSSKSLDFKKKEKEAKQMRDKILKLQKEKEKKAKENELKEKQDNIKIDEHKQVRKLYQICIIITQKA